MSILLEALRQKSRGNSDVKKETASALTPNTVSNDFVGQQGDKPHDAVLSLESLLEPLNIQPPEHLSWQLSAENRHREPQLEVVEEHLPEGLNDDSALSLLFPIADESARVVDAPIEPLVEHLESLDSLNLSLISLDTEQDNNDIIVSNEHELAVENLADAHLTPLDMPSHTTESHPAEVVLTHDEHQPTPEPSVAPIFLEEGPAKTLSIEKPDTVFEAPLLNANKANTPASATSYLNLLNKNRAAPEQPVFSKKIRLQKPAISPKVILASLLSVTFLGVGYYGFALWEEDQRQVAEQMARYEAPIVMQPITSDTPVANTEQDAPKSLVDTGLPVPVVDVSEQTHTSVSRTPSVAMVEPKKRRQPIEHEQQSPSKPAVAVVVKALSISDLINSGWQAWRAGDLVMAEANYRQVLERQPNNRDALMGMFAITQLQPATNTQSQEIAERLIELYPQDAEVKALVANVFYTNGISAEHNESYLKNQLQNTPNNAETYYQLGILYANTKRWSDAQGAFFKAVSLDSGQAEYLANLAISYDQLGKVELAISGYQKALDAARVRPSLLNQDALAARLQFLLSQLSQGA
jgi:tetratricopeptide (TPR) repeat protein